jgi:hypothetical protein
MNTLDTAAPNQTSNASKNRSQDASRKQSGILGPKDHKPGSTTGYSTRTTGNEPPCKRQRVESHCKPYVKDEGAGVVSPVFSSTEDDVVVTKSQMVITPSSKQSRLSEPSIALAITVDEYRSVEETMQTNFPKTRSKVVSPYFSPERSKRPRQPSVDSDSENFTRGSKKARYKERANELPDSVSEIYEDTPRPRKSADRADTPGIISTIFNPSILPTKEKRQTSQGADHSDTVLITKSDPGLIDPREQIDALQRTDSAAHTHMSRLHQAPAAKKSIPAKKLRAGSKRSHSQSGTFQLRQLKYGILPEEESYRLEVSEGVLRFYKNEALLSKEPICPDIAVGKLFKIYHGIGNDCLMLMLEISHTHGQSYDKPCLEFDSRQDKEEFLSLLPRLGTGSILVPKAEYVYFPFRRPHK